MARKDDPVFNVKFVQLVENQACLWNYTHPGYSKKEEVQKAWQHVANEIKDTVRNSRERWRTIRSSFLRSLKAARTSTGRGKRKYYLSKYLQFLIPYTKSRACHKQLPAQSSANANAMPNPNQSPNNAGGMVLRKPSTSTTAATFLAAAALGTQPMTRIGHMRLLEHHHHHQQQHQEQHHQEQQHHHSHQVNECDDNTKDSIDSQPAHVQVSEEELDQEQQEQQQHEDEPEQETVASQLAQTPLRLQAIKVEQQQNADKIVAAAAQHSLVTLPVTMAAALRNNMDWTVAEWLKGSNSQLQLQHLHHSNNNNNNNSSNSNMLTHLGHAATTPPAASTPAPPAAAAAAATPTAAAQPDADYSFLISLHPYLKEMSGKQNRRFRQKVVGLIDNVLDNVDV